MNKKVFPTHKTTIRMPYLRPVLLLGALLVLLGYASCEKQDLTFKGPAYVRFTNESASAKESFSKPIQIPVHNVGPILTEPINLTYSVSGSAREGIDYVIQGERGVVVIPANRSFGYITIRLINNANNILESQNIVFTITGVTPGTLGIGTSKNGIIGKTTTFTIQDDCILGGTYIGTRGGNVTPIPDITITSANCETYTLSSWNIGLIQYPTINLSLTFRDNGDNTLTIPEQEQVRLSSNEKRFLIQGAGSINPANGVITLNIQSVDPTDSLDVVTTFIPDK